MQARFHGHTHVSMATKHLACWILVALTDIATEEEEEKEEEEKEEEEEQEEEEEEEAVVVVIIDLIMFS